MVGRVNVATAPFDDYFETVLQAEAGGHTNHPQGRVGGVVFGGFAAIGKSIGDGPVFHVGEEAFDDLFGDFRLVVKQARETDHRIAAPVGEPWITGNDAGRAIGAANQERVGTWGWFGVIGAVDGGAD